MTMTDHHPPSATSPTPVDDSWAAPLQHTTPATRTFEEAFPDGGEEQSKDNYGALTSLVTWLLPTVPTQPSQALETQGQPRGGSYTIVRRFDQDAVLVKSLRTRAYNMGHIHAFKIARSDVLARGCGLSETAWLTHEPALVPRPFSDDELFKVSAAFVLNGGSFVGLQQVLFDILPRFKGEGLLLEAYVNGLHRR